MPPYITPLPNENSTPNELNDGAGNCMLYKCICKCFHAIDGKMIKKVSK